MPRLGIRFLAPAVLVFLSATLTARADPINNFVAAYSDSLGLVTTAPVSLPDLTTGGSVVLGTLPIVGPSTPSNPPEDTPINGTFNLQIGWADSSSPISISVPGVYPLIATGGTLTVVSPVPPRGRQPTPVATAGRMAAASSSQGRPASSTTILNSLHCGSIPIAFRSLGT
jgi:hypothetical protein